jgi:hypothetical protein
MTWIVDVRPKIKTVLLALLALGLSCQNVSAATAVTVKNTGPVTVQIGFDGAPVVAVAPRGEARLSLNDGEHTTQCRFEGYDGCNIADRFTIEGAKEMMLNLQPVLTPEHAIAMAAQGTLSVETRPNVWAVTALNVSGAAEECLDYAQGKMAAVSRNVRNRMPIRNVTLATQNLCGRTSPAIGTTLDGAQVYFPLRFVLFKEKSGRAVLIR